MLSQNGKKARAEQVHIRTTGSVSHARKRDEFNLKYKRQANEVELFDFVYQTKKGSYIDDTLGKLMDRAKAEISKKISQLDNSEPIVPEKLSEIERDVMRELMGSDKPGRARGYGAGVRESHLTTFSHNLRRLRGEDSRQSTLLAKLDSQDKQIKTQHKQIKTAKRN